MPAGTNPRAFNRACAAAALVVIVGAHIGSYFLRGASYQDFPQYYMGGVMARLGLWDSLYPIPLPGSIYNPGWEDQSAVRQRYLEEADRQGIGEFGFRFIQSPPVAVLFMPLTLLEYPRAYVVWMLMLAAAMWVVALQAGRVYVIARGGEDRVAGLIILVVACSVLAYRAVRVGNVSPIVGMCVGIVVLDLVRPRAGGVVAGAAMTLGAFAKYATPVLAPLHLLLRRWAVLLWAAASLAMLVALTLTLAGSGPFVEFVRDIAPTLGRSHPTQANQSIEGLLLRLTREPTLPPALVVTVRIMQLTIIAILLWMIFRQRHNLARQPALMFAAAAALVSWLLVFGPLYWEHYPVYLCPLWGWLAWEARGSPLRMGIVIAAIAMAWVPVPAIQWIRLPEPINSHILASTLLILGLAVWRLAQQPRLDSRGGL